MFSSSFPLRLNKRFSFSSHYQLGMSMRNFMDFALDAKVIKFTSVGFSQNTQQVASTQFFSTLQDGDIIPVGGTALIQRESLGTGLLTPEEEDLIPHPITFIDSFYPRFSGGGFGSRLFLDFGKTLNNGGNFYPYLDAYIGDAEIVGNYEAGSIEIENLGSLPLYSTQPYSTRVLANGTVSILERYSNLQPAFNKVTRKQNIILTKIGEFSNLEEYQPFCRGVKLTHSFSEDSILIRAPEISGTIRITLISESLRDRFRSAEITIV